MATLTSDHNHTSPAHALGPGLSIACGIHCVATPLLVLALPALVPALHFAHPVFAALVALVAAWAFIPAYRCHRRPIVFVEGAVGVALLVAGALAADVSTALDVGLTLSGAAVMIWAHWHNRALLRAAHGNRGETKPPEVVLRNT